jgi:hypothetical protein
VYEWLPSDASTATITLSQAIHADGAAITFVVSADDASTLEQSEVTASVLQAPVIAFDPENPQPALDEIARLDSDRVVVFSDDPPAWMLEQLQTRAMMVETAALPVPRPPAVVIEPAGVETPEVAFNIPDRFATVIAGRVDRIWRSHQDEYKDFIDEYKDFIDEYKDFIVQHRSLVLTDDKWANKYLGQKSWNSPGKYADADLLWWNTGDGWVGTESIDDVPSPGFAYLTERRATPWTLAFLGSLAESPPMPVWTE